MKIITDNFNPPLPASLQIYYFTEINSLLPNFRNDLRKQLKSELQNLNVVESLDSLMDLSTRPHTSSYNISLSHSPKGSAIALIDKHHLIGVDCEEKSRINDKIIKRISLPSEITRNSESKDYLFPAKESAWKALNKSYQLTNISQIETLNWTIPKNDWRQFKVSIGGQIIDGSGFVYEYSDTYLSFYYCHLTFG